MKEKQEAALETGTAKYPGLIEAAIKETEALAILLAMASCVFRKTL
jgi:hypothetical protein